MFSINTANRFTCIFNKVPYLIFLLMIFSVVAIITSQPAHAETSTDQETKVRNAVVKQLFLMENKLKSKYKKNKEDKKENKKTSEVPENISEKEKDVDAPDIDSASKNRGLEDKKEMAIIDIKKAQDINQINKVTEDKNLKIQQVKAKSDEETKNITLKDKKEVVVVDVKKAQDIKQAKKVTQDDHLKAQQVKAKSLEKTKNITLKDKKEVVIVDVKKAQDIKQAKKVTQDDHLKAQQVKAKSLEKTKNITLKDKKEVVVVDVKKHSKVQETKQEKNVTQNKMSAVQKLKKENDTKQTNVAKDDNLKIKQIISKKTPKKEPVDDKKSDKKPSFTPLVDILSEEELQALMQDVVLSSESSSKTQNIAIKPIVESSTKGKDNVTKLTDEEKTADNKKSSSTSGDTAKSKVTKIETTKTDNKTTQLKSQPIPIGRQELGRNIKPESSSNKKTATKKIEGWIYLGKFKSNQWENQTLDIEKKLPKVGSQYAIKATMVNVRDRLPKKGKMGKVITAIKHKQTVNILQLRRLGRNRIYYWAKIEHQRGNLRANN